MDWNIFSIPAQRTPRGKARHEIPQTLRGIKGPNLGNENAGMREPTSDKNDKEFPIAGKLIILRQHK